MERSKDHRRQTGRLWVLFIMQTYSSLSALSTCDPEIFPTLPSFGIFQFYKCIMETTSLLQASDAA